MIRVTLERPSAALAAQWAELAPFADNAFMHPVALEAASKTLLAVITVLLAWDTAVEPNKLVGWWALQGKHLLLWPYFETLPFNYAFLSTPVIAPDMAAEVMPAFLAAVAHEKGLPHTLRVRDLDAAGPAADAIRAAGLPHTTLDGDQRPIATREVGIKRSGSTRKKLRQDWNRLAATGKLEAVDVRDPAEIGAALEAFLEMEAASWKGNRGTALLSDPADAAFARRLIADMSAIGQASVALLKLDGKPIAAQVLLYSGRTAYTWKTSYDLAHAKHSPGTLLVDWISTQLLDSNAVDTIDSCAVGDSFMANLLSGRKPIGNMVLSARPGFSPSYLAVAGYYRLRQLAKTVRNRVRNHRHAPKAAPAQAPTAPLSPQAAPMAGPFAETATLHAAAAPGPKADRAA
jgi:hypothetical protein